MKKVLFTSHTANFAKFNQPLMQDLRKQGYIVHYASADDEPVENVDKHIIVDFARSPYRLNKHLRAYRQLRKLLKSEQYDLIHTHTPTGGVVTRMAAKHQKETPLIYTAHGFHFYRGAPLMNWLLFYPVEKWLAKDTDLLLTINHEDEALVKKRFHPKAAGRLDGAGVDLTRFHPIDTKAKSRLRKKYGYQDDDFILIYVAELNKNKDQKFIIENAKNLANKIPHLKILLVGDGAWRRKLEQLVKRLGLQEVIEFLGYRKDINELYPLADIVISASQREGLGLSVIEGMASGLPAVVRDNRGHREIIDSEKIGRLFQTGAEFQEVITELYNQPQKRHKMGQSAAKAIDRFSLEKTRSKMQQIYQQFLSK